MDCEDAQALIVAWQDGELSKSGAAQVEEHLSRCQACAWTARRLSDISPKPFLRPPEAVLSRLDRSLDVDLLLQRAAQPAPAESGWRRWLARQRSISHAELLVAAALWALSLGMGASWWADRQGAPASASVMGSEIPGEQFAPASYTPEAERDIP